jgi:hypothetical protein
MRFLGMTGSMEMVEMRVDRTRSVSGMDMLEGR